MSEWKHVKWDSDPNRKTLERAGYIGGSVRFTNAHTLELGYSYNGSGKEHFGGAKQWPVLILKVSFCEGEERKRDILARTLLGIIEKFMEEQNEGRG